MMFEKKYMEIFKEIEGRKKVVVLNKIDLPLRVCREDLKSRFQEDPIVSVSSLKNKGIDDLNKTIYASLIHRQVRSSPEHVIVANTRHKTALSQTKDNLASALNSLKEETSLEIVAFEIRYALEALGGIVGETTSEEVLNRIFEQFCIGK